MDDWTTDNRNVFKFIPKSTSDPADAPRQLQQDLLAKLEELHADAERGELLGVALVGLYSEDRFGITWVGNTPIPHMIGYLEFLKERMISSAYQAGIEGGA